MENKKLLAYIYNEEGFHAPAITIDDATEQVAGFIVATSASPAIVITDTADNLVLNTIRGFVDKCVERAFLEKLLPVLIPIQMGDTAIPELTLSWERWADDYTAKDVEGFKSFIKKEFDGISV